MAGDNQDISSVLDPNLGQPTLSRYGGSDEEDVQLTPERQAERAAVKQWTVRIQKAKAFFRPDFERMRENQEFVHGLQWEGQKAIRDAEDRYIANIVLRIVKQKEATLYAKNPTVEVQRRKRMDFALWDEDVQSLVKAALSMQQSMGTDINAAAVLLDYQQGEQRRSMVDKFAKTLENLLQYTIDNHKPDFLEQMKQAVGRAIVSSVAYCRPHFIREGQDTTLTSMEMPNEALDRAKAAKRVLDRIEDGDVQDEDPEVESLRSLVLSLSASNEEPGPSERVEYDFPPATSVIVDPRCRSLKEFVAANWIVQEYIIPVEDANEIFQVEINPAATQISPYDEKGQQQLTTYDQPMRDSVEKPLVAIWEVFNKRDHTRFFICDGYKDFLVEPMPVDIEVSGFWQLFALVFNNTETEPGTKATIYPPSDVDLVRCAQQEWNRTRDANRNMRNANQPTYLVKKGMLSEADRDAIRNREPNEVVELEQCPADKKPSDVIEVLQTKGVDPALYETASLQEDLMNAGGVQEANIGNAPSDVTATGSTIAEQSRLTVTASNVDDLDMFLSRLMRCTGEMVLSPQGMSDDMVRQIVGPGALWGQMNRSMFLDEVIMRIKAASSGRPNQALSIANFERIAPIMLQAGANPIAVIEEGVRRMDDQLDVSKFFPLPGMLPMAGQEPSPRNGKPSMGGGSSSPSSSDQAGGDSGGAVAPSAGPLKTARMMGRSGVGNEQPLQPAMSGAAVPLAGH